MKIAYVAGWLRSGTTLVCHELGKLPDTVGVGESVWLWRAARTGEACSCGSPALECELWGPVIADVLQKNPGLDIEQLERMWATYERTKRLPQMVAAHLLGTKVLSGEFRLFLSVLDDFYEAIGRHSGRSIAIDSSKFAPGFVLASLLGSTEVAVVHVVRDPRAVAFSESRAHRVRATTDVPPPPVRGVVASAAWWSITNALILVASRFADAYQRVSYEDFATHSDDYVRALDRGVTPGGSLRVASDVDPMVHIAVGNPARMGMRNVLIAVDDRWKTGLSAREKAMVMVVSAPVRLLLAGVRKGIVRPGGDGASPSGVVVSRAS